MKRTIKSTVSVAVSALLVSAGLAVAAGGAQDSWYRTGEQTGAGQGPQADTTDASRDSMHAPMPNAVRREESFNAEGRGNWRHKRRHAGRGRGGKRLYGQDLTKAQFFDRMQQRFERYDVDGNGFVDVADLEAFIEARKTNGRGGRRNRGGDRLFRMMERLDANADTKVTFEEFMAQADRRFTRLDHNGDGRLNVADLRPARSGQQAE